MVTGEYFIVVTEESYHGNRRVCLKNQGNAGSLPMIARESVTVLPRYHVTVLTKEAVTIVTAVC